MLTYKRKLILTKAQQSRIDNWIGTCRVIYNLGLEIKISAWKNKQQSVHRYELMGQLKTLNHIDWIKDVPRDSLVNAIDRLDNSYSVFFRGGGFPKWANKRKYKSITFKQCIYTSGSYVRVPKLGKLKIFKDAEITGKVKMVTIIKDPTGYFACITTDLVKSIQNKDENQVIGLDMGIKYFCVDSNGNFIDNPKHFKVYEKQLRIENRSLARKKKGSNSWKKQVKKLSLLHHRIGNVRKDFLHKESTKIAKENHTVILEDLKISYMSKSKIGKHILDCGWATFRTLLSYKTKVIAINPRFTSQTCNSCGAKDAKSRISQSEFVCTNCGEIANADENAAKNILGKGIALNRKRETLVCA